MTRRGRGGERGGGCDDCVKVWFWHQMGITSKFSRPPAPHAAARLMHTNASDAGTTELHHTVHVRADDTPLLASMP
jgi:hypothetical protein